jgi:hypothetical protein
MRILNGIFIAVFMVMLTLPLIFVDLASDRISVRENRMLAQRPRLADIKHHTGIFIRDFDAWFKDSTGFREQLVTLYNVVYRNWRSTVWYTEGQLLFLVGEHGHRYSVQNEQMQKFQGKQILSNDQLVLMSARLEEVKTYLDRQSIPLIVMFCTDKETIYPEFYPKSIKRGPEPVQLDIITGYLQEHAGVDVFNIRQALFTEKNNYVLYNVSSGDLSHYNEIGAFFAYRELMKHINAYLPEIIPYELGDVDIDYDRMGISHVSLKQKKVYKELDTSFFDGVSLIRPFSWQNIAFENLDYSLPTILFLRDSYTDESFIGKYIAQHFGKTIFIHFYNLEHFEKYINRYKPDIVVFESAEHQLRWFAENVSKISISR